MSPEVMPRGGRRARAEVIVEEPTSAPFVSKSVDFE